MRAASNAPLAALRDAPPRRVRPLLSRRLHDEVLQQLGPRSPDGILHRYVVAEFPNLAQRDAALRQAQHDPMIEAVHINERLPWPSQSASPASPPGGGKRPTTPASAGKTTTVFPQYHREVLGIDSAWQIAGGWGLVGVVDNGLYPSHPELRSFNGATFVQGGNLLPALSLNVAGQGQLENNLDELQPGNVRSDGSDVNCDVDGDQWITPEVAGHGTHVAGLVAANAADGVGVSGTCRHCGLAMMKASQPVCEPKLGGGFGVFSAITEALAAAGATELRRSGAQVVSLSFGSGSQSCFGANDPLCTALTGALEDDVLVVAAAGNALESLKVPAYSRETVAVAGTNTSGKRWDISAPPNSIQDCPYYPFYTEPPLRRRECGSNWSVGSLGSNGAGSLELSAPAQTIRSTIYPDKTWNDLTVCGDAFGGGPASDGYGVCTGTSMSAPVVAGIFGMLRSVHPLLRSGDHPRHDVQTAVPGLRKVAAETAVTPANDAAPAPPPSAIPPYGFPWSYYLGFGRPDAYAAQLKLLGVSFDTPIVNRVAPLFRLFGVEGSDYAAVATPQLAIALTLRQRKISPKYISLSALAGLFRAGQPVPGYGQFPNPAAGAPRAAALILTTERAPDDVALNPIPLFLLERQSDGPTRDFVLLSSSAEVQTAVSVHGYSYLGRQGYIYPYCIDCAIPDGVEILHQKCKPSASDCAVFLESERSGFESDGYTALFPSSSGSQLGFAYPVLDSDSDGLPDGAERVLGTSHLLADSDGDSLSDSSEYPFAGVPVSDPCSGTTPACPRAMNKIFRNGFEGDPQ